MKPQESSKATQMENTMLNHPQFGTDKIKYFIESAPYANLQYRSLNLQMRIMLAALILFTLYLWHAPLNLSILFLESIYN